MTIYLDRLKDWHDKHSQPAKSQEFSYWKPYTTINFPYVVRVTTKDRTYYEEAYKGYQIIIVGWHSEFDIPLTSNGQNIGRGQWADAEKLAHSYIKGGTTDSYVAYAWKIEDNPSHALNWRGEESAFDGTFSGRSPEESLKKAKKKVDILASLDAVHAELVNVCQDFIYFSDRTNPYNVIVGDFVYIPAFGKLRKGKVIKTSGSKFVVGYVTPSNHKQVKYKTLPLQGLFIKK